MTRPRSAREMIDEATLWNERCAAAAELGTAAALFDNAWKRMDRAIRRRARSLRTAAKARGKR